MYAIIETGGKQVRVEEGVSIFVEKLDANEGDTYVFDKVLCACLDNNKIQFGAPYINGAKVTAKVEKQGRGKKIIVFKYKPKKNERKKQGHRQSYTKLVVEKISL